MPMGGFHRVYDTIGNSKTLNTCMRVLGSMGVLSVVGIGKDVKLDLTPLWLKLQTIKGVFAYGRVDYQGEKKHVFEVALDLMDKKKISADILVTHRFSLEKYREMIAVNMNKGKHRAIKTIVIF
jgi:(R,R)-butanediol dehydrogenase / meso-butanediol dehydrogenase / diacetyl reductase